MGFVKDIFSSPLTGLAVQGVGVGMSVAAAKQQAQAEKLARQWQATLYRQQAEVARLQAEEQRKLGESEAGMRRLEANKLKGEQRVAYGASGVDVNWGSAAYTQADTMAWGEHEAQKELYNYGMAGWAKDNEARILDFEARRQEAGAPSSSAAMVTEAISGFTSMYDRYSNWRK